MATRVLSRSDEKALNELLDLAGDVGQFQFAFKKAAEEARRQKMNDVTFDLVKKQLKRMAKTKVRDTRPRRGGGIIRISASDRHHPPSVQGRPAKM